MTAPKQHDVFLSYKREDSDIMARVRDALRADGVVVWTDEHIEIADHDTWQKSIDLALNDSKSLVVLISEASITDSDIPAQAQTAQGLGLPIFPVLIKDVPSDIPSPSYTTEPYIDIRGNNLFFPLKAFANGCEPLFSHCLRDKNFTDLIRLIGFG